MTTLTELYLSKKYDTDKYNLGYIENYYNDFFSEFQDKDVSLLEIGIWNGGSLKMWRDCLTPKSKVFGADINGIRAIPGVELWIKDMYTEYSVSNIQDNQFDIIIDDGPHTYESFVFLIKNYQNKLKEGGCLIVEDIIKTEWVDPLVRLGEELGYSSVKVIDMSGKQKTPKLYNMWKNGLFILELKK